MTVVTELADLTLTPDERARGIGVDSALFVMDWTGEEDPGGLAAFVAGRVRAFGAQPGGSGPSGTAGRRGSPPAATPVSLDCPRCGPRAIGNWYDHRASSEYPAERVRPGSAGPA
ncbi:hypothetical protein [Micromonospora wenchangensis]|uniref:hypothetical protein n=1 Tax=Micromonospora wenchangensis TaxID=1185415 RepID=UPI003D7455B8